MRFWLFLAILLLTVPVLAQSDDDNPKCTDLVVIAKILKQEPMPIPDIPDVWIFRWTWHLDIEVKEVLAGPMPPYRMRVRALMHTYYRADIDYWVMSFTRGKFGYELDRGRLLMGLVKDRDGHVVLPVSEPLDENEVAPRGLLSPDYQSRLEPIALGPDGVSWMKKESDDGRLMLNADEWVKANKSGTSQDWLTENNGWIVPKRGLSADTLRAMVRENLPRCPKR